MATSMHTWDDDTNRFAHAVIDYAVERVHLAKDTQWGAHPADVLQAAIAQHLSRQGRQLDLATVAYLEDASDRIIKVLDAPLRGQ